MKFRSFLLVACMLVVPAAAMFSHRIPPSVRKACWRVASRPMEECLGWLKPQAEAAPAGSPPTAVASGGVAVSPSSSTTTTTTTTTAAAAPASAAAPPAATAPPLPSAKVSDSQTSGRDVVQRELAACGATSIECRPLDGGGAACVASCHVAIDATGQLLRVFQAVGAGPDEAHRALLDDVAAWRRRTSGVDRLGLTAPSAEGRRR